jgi:hypothetical protein
MKTLAGECGAGGTLGGAAYAGPANRYTVGAVGFGSCWEQEPSLRELYDIACATIVRQEAEADELRAEVAMLLAEREIMASEINGYRDEACRESCRDKASADGGWSNI